MRALTTIPPSPFAALAPTRRAAPAAVPGPALRSGARALLALCLLAAALPAAAIDYTVEIVLFEHRRGPVVGDDRYWVPTPTRALGLGSAEAAAAGFEPVEALTLSAEAERMRANGYRVLRHFAWRQPGLDAANAVPIRVNLGERLSLWVPGEAEPGAGFLPASPAEREDRPRAVTTTTVAGTLKVRLGRFLHLEAKLAYDDPATGTGYRLDESRKMRSRELHYLDNPRFGLLTRIVPVEEGGDGSDAPLVPTGAPPAPSEGLSEDGLPDVDDDAAPGTAPGDADAVTNDAPGGGSGTGDVLPVQ